MGATSNNLHTKISPHHFSHVGNANDFLVGKFHGIISYHFQNIMLKNQKYVKDMDYLTISLETTKCISNKKTQQVNQLKNLS